MRLIPQKVKLDAHVAVAENGKPDAKRHGPLFPATVRCIICGPSNCGKTNVMMRMIEDPNGLRFQNVYVFSKSLHQPKYQRLAQILGSIQGMTFFQFRDSEGIVKPDEALPNSLFVFDDIACDKQDTIRQYFSMGRHNAVDVFYLNQTYSRIPKQLVRDNANFIVLFRQDCMNLRHVFEDHVDPDMTFQQFRDMCAICWNSDPHGFLVIDKDSEPDSGRYRKGFDVYIKR